MKRDFLKGLGLEDTVIDKIMAENGLDINREKIKAENFKTELEETKTLLATANDTIKSYKDMDIEGIKASADEWKTKYETDTEELNKKIASINYDYAVKEYMNGFKFIDDDVKETVINKFKAKEFKLEDGKFLGADDFMKDYKEAHKSLFVDEEEEKIPTIVKPASNNPAPKGKKMSLTEAMKYVNEHPDVNIRDLI